MLMEETRSREMRQSAIGRRCFSSRDEMKERWRISEHSLNGNLGIR